MRRRDRCNGINGPHIRFAGGNCVNACASLTRRRVRVSCPGDGVPLISVATSRRTRFRLFRLSRIVAAVHCFPYTAGMLRRRGSLEHDRQECSGEREQQQKPCSKTLHVFF